MPWIDESLDPDTGRWIDFGEYPLTRGRHYNHSTYCDLIVTGLIGLRPRADDMIEINPLVGNSTWDWFCMERIPYHGHQIAVIWDRKGKKYGLGKGLMVFVDGKESGRRRDLGIIKIRCRSLETL